MAEKVAFRIKPKHLPESIYRCFKYEVLDLRKSSGAIIEDCCRDLSFIKQDNVRLEIKGRPAIKLPTAYTVGKVRHPTNSSILFRLIFLSSNFSRG